jgi:hypothetical protein
VPVTLLLALAFIEVRRAPSVAGHWSHATRLLPRYLTRLFHHRSGATQVPPDATVAAKPPAPVQGKSDAQ